MPAVPFLCCFAGRGVADVALDEGGLLVRADPVAIGRCAIEDDHVVAHFFALVFVDLRVLARLFSVQLPVREPTAVRIERVLVAVVGHGSVVEGPSDRLAFESVHDALRSRT
jgi:hypothetical protein